MLYIMYDGFIIVCCCVRGVMGMNFFIVGVIAVLLSKVEMSMND